MKRWRSCLTEMAEPSTRTWCLCRLDQLLVGYGRVPSAPCVVFCLCVLCIPIRLILFPAIRFCAGDAQQSGKRKRVLQRRRGSFLGAVGCLSPEPRFRGSCLTCWCASRIGSTPTFWTSTWPTCSSHSQRFSGDASSLRMIPRKLMMLSRPREHDGR